MRTADCSRQACFVCLISWIASTNLCSSHPSGIEGLVSWRSERNSRTILRLRGGNATEEDTKSEQLLQEIAKLDPVTFRQLYKIAINANAWNCSDDGDINKVILSP
eukprot:765351-Hanusia_phi.AAC.1